MKRYHEEKHISANRVAMYKRLGGYLDPEHADYVPDTGKFRKTLRCAGCGQSRCQLCHPEKYPKRTPTRQELQARRDLHEEN